MTEPLHPFADAALAAIKVTDKSAVIPPAALEDLRRRLAQSRDLAMIEHLAVAAFRLRERKLTRASAQLTELVKFALARIAQENKAAPDIAPPTRKKEKKPALKPAKGSSVSLRGRKK